MKNAISILQEYAVSKGWSIPQYHFENQSSNLMTPKFTCFCICDTSKTFASASNKKEAKANSANEMLINLGINISTMQLTFDSGIEFNAIGTLNEYLIKHGHAYASYEEIGFEDGMFAIECRHLNYVSKGLAGNKKTAKQNAASEMLKLVNAIGSVSSTNRNAECFQQQSQVPNTLKMRYVDRDIQSPTISSVSPDNEKNKEIVSLVPRDNYVGKLNEYCNKWQYKTPEYIEMGTKNKLYVTHVIHQSYVAEGLGETVKASKQAAAAEMLVILGKRSPTRQSRISNDPVTSQSTVSDKHAIDVYNELSILKDLKIKHSNEQKIVDPFKNTENGTYCNMEVKNVTNMIKQKEARLNNKNIKYKIDELSFSPFMLSFVCLDPLNFTLVEIDDDKDQALLKLLTKAFKKLGVE